MSASSPMHYQQRELYSELAQTAQEARLLDTVLQAVNTSTSEEELIHTIGFGIKELLPYERWSRVGLSLITDNQRLHVYRLIGERNNPFWDAVGKGVSAAAYELGVSASLVMATMTSETTQEMLIDQAIRDGISGIAIAPADSEALEPAIRRARAAGIPIITYATPPAEGSAAILDIGVDNERAGRMVGEVFQHLLPDGGSIASSVYSIEQMNMRQRMAGLEAALVGSSITLLPPFAIYDDREKGLQHGIEILNAHPEVRGVFGAASLNGPTWVSALEATQRSDTVAVVGFDLVPATVAMLKAGAIYATVAQREQEMGYRCVELLCKLITDGVEATLATLPPNHFVEVGLDLVTLERTPWSTALTDYLRHQIRYRVTSSVVNAVIAHGKPIRLMVIGILPQADPVVQQQTTSLQLNSFIGQVIATERTVVIAPHREESVLFRPMRERGTKTLIGVPLRTNQRALGVLTLESDDEDAGTPEELAIIERISSVLVVALENGRLLRQTIERQRALEEAARRQDQLLQTILELSNPIATIAPGILVMPLLGVIDEQRADRLIETLLTAITKHSAESILIDISAVPIVDTSVANTIIQATQAAKMLGAEVIIVGIAPSVAQTIVSLGVDVRRMTTHADLESGFRYALKKRGGYIRYS